MIINRKTKIVGKNVILIPYRKEHVPKYHEWMKSVDLQELTGSKPLSLDEEYEMQISWVVDSNKVTFIILDKAKWEETRNEIESMIGDTNLFFHSIDNKLAAETEIMIAEQWARGRKCGWEAMLLMMVYGAKLLDVKLYTAKIKTFNEISLNMFKKMGFIEMGRSAIFDEITMEKEADGTWITWLESNLGDYDVVEEEQ